MSGSCLNSACICLRSPCNLDFAAAVSAGHTVNWWRISVTFCTIQSMIRYHGSFSGSLLGPGPCLIISTQPDGPPKQRNPTSSSCERFPALLLCIATLPGDPRCSASSWSSCTPHSQPAPGVAAAHSRTASAGATARAQHLPATTSSQQQRLAGHRSVSWCRARESW